MLRRPSHARAILAVFVVPSLMLAQQANPPAPVQAPGKLAARSDLVLVPVVVTDKSGRAVGGLTQDAFRVEENGKPQNVAVFEEVKTDKAAGAASPNSWHGRSNFRSPDAGPSRFIIVVLDMINTPWMRQVDAKEQLIAYLLHSVNRDEPIALFGLTGSGLRQLHSFTTDTTVLIDALQKLKLSISSEEGTQPPANLTDDGTSEQQNSADLALMSDFMADLDTVVSNAYERQAIRQTLRSMAQLSRAYTGLPGRKTLVWATAGFPFMIDDPQAFARMGEDMRAEFEQTWRSLGSANIAVYPVDLSALEFSTAALPSATYGQSTSSTNINNIRGSNGMKSAMRIPYDKAVQQQMTLHAFADTTGGRACITTNELEKCFATAIDDSRDYYLLGYYLADPAKPGWRKLKVKVSGDGLRERSRQGFYVPSKVEDTLELRRAELTEALTSPVEYSGLRLNVQQLKPAAAHSPGSEGKSPQDSPASAPAPSTTSAGGGPSPTSSQTTPSAAGDKKPAEFLLAVLGNSLTIDRQRDNAIDLEVAAVAFDAKHRNAATISQAVATNLKPDLMQKVVASSLGLKQRLDLPAGRYEVKFAVRDNLSGLLGTVTVPVAVE